MIEFDFDFDKYSMQKKVYCLLKSLTLEPFGSSSTVAGTCFFDSLLFALGRLTYICP